MSVDDTLKKREKTYGCFTDVAELSQSLYSLIESSDNFDDLSNTHKEAFKMILQKMARCCCGDINYIDNIHDIAGYATLLESFLEEKNGK